MGTLPTGTVTFLFTDIEGSTKLAREHGEMWETLRARHHDILRRAIESNHGYVFQIIGDAFCAAFPTAGYALRAAAKSQMDLYSENRGNAPIKVRMGIHTGKAEIQENGEYHGYLAMSRIQRLMSAGHGGQVLISAATQELLWEDLPEDVSLRDLGERRLKDMTRPEHIYQLVSANLPVDFPPIKSLDALPNNLPIQLTSFIGREKELHELKQLIERTRLVTLTGVGGTGKTRLALQAAADALEDFHDGAWFVELAPLSDPALVPQAVSTALGLREQPERTFLDILKDYLARKNLLLLLDNCEHLIEACAQLADTLLHTVPQLKILATSREALGIAGESAYPVRSLSLPDTREPLPSNLSQYEAVRLFIDRAVAVQPSFQVTNQNAPAVAQVCTRLDGIPLAIELAAARIKGLSAEQIASRLDDRFRLLTGGSRTALPRQRTLQAAIDWSYKLLSDEERVLLRQLSVFAGGWTLEAAEHVCVSRDLESGQILDLLLRLVDKSLVVANMNASEPRYHMLETIRQYAQEKLSESEEDKMLRAQHLAYFLNLSEKGDRELHRSNQLEWLNRLGSMRDNLRLALEWAIESRQTESALQMARKLHWFWFVLGDHTEGRQWLGRVLEMPETSLHPEAQAEILAQVAHHVFLQIRPRDAKPFSEQALAIARAHEDKHNTARALAMLSLSLMAEKNFAAAQSALEESQALFRAVGDQWGYAVAVFILSWSAYSQENWSTSLTLAAEALDAFSQLGDRYFMSVGWSQIGATQLKQGNWMEGETALQKALILAQQMDSKYEIASALFRLSVAAQHAKRPGRAVNLCWAAKNVFELIGAWQPEDDLLLENELAPCRAVLSESAFAEAMSQGHSMTMEQAIAFALEETND